MDLKEMGAYLTTPTPRDILRIEARNWYESAADVEHFARFLNGEPAQVDAGWQGWLNKLAADKAAGTTWRRVHVIAMDCWLTDYLKFEFGEQYTRNAEAGEQIRILEVLSRDLVKYRDFYVADGERVALMEYDAGGKFVQADQIRILPGEWALHAEHLWAEAVPFEQWWASYQRKAA
jgi:hypothetical protein